MPNTSPSGCGNQPDRQTKFDTNTSLSRFSCTVLSQVITKQSLSLNDCLLRCLDKSWLCGTCAIHHLSTSLDVVHAIQWTIRFTAERKSSFQNHTGGRVALMADAALMDHAVISIPREVGFAVASR